MRLQDTKLILNLLPNEEYKLYNKQSKTTVKTVPLIYTQTTIRMNLLLFELKTILLKQEEFF